MKSFVRAKVVYQMKISNFFNIIYTFPYIFWYNSFRENRIQK